MAGTLAAEETGGDAQLEISIRSHWLAKVVLRSLRGEEPLPAAGAAAAAPLSSGGGWLLA